MAAAYSGEPSEPPMPGFSWSALSRLIRLRNQSGTLLLLWPSWWSLWFASRGTPPVLLLLVFGAGAFLMRSAGVILNDLADRRFDRQVTRTQARPLAARSLTPFHALLTLIVLLSAAAGLLILLPELTWSLSPVAVVLAAVYPFAKRVLAVPQAVLGIAFGWGTIMAWAAVHQRVQAPAWLLMAGTVWWAIAYDTIYAIQDREDDRRIGVKSSAILFGPYTWIAVLVCEVAMLGCLTVTGWLTESGPMFYAGLGCVGGFFIVQALRLRTLVRPEDAFRLFTQHVWVGLAILIGIALGFA